MNTVNILCTLLCNIGRSKKKLITKILIIKKNFFNFFLDHISSVSSNTAMASINPGENTPLKQRGEKVSSKVVLGKKYWRYRKCITSQAGLLILVWGWVVGLVSGLLLNPDLFLQILTHLQALGAYGGAAVLLCFFPAAGYLADVKFGRYRTVVASVILVLVSVSLLALTGVVSLPPIVLLGDGFPRYGYIAVAFACLFVIVLYVGLIGFTANVVQFGMDQLHDSPGEDRTLFIHWYVWLYYVSIVVGQLTVTLPYASSSDSDLSFYNYIGFCMMAAIPLLVIVVLIVSLCLVRYKERWFLIEPGRTNPYKLVYKITKFAYQHKIPVYRSAFTYCEDEVPKGLDLGKEKYGGCFSTEQVEDVKAFYGILKVLFSFGAVFFLDFAANSILPLYALHTTPSSSSTNGTLEEPLIELILLNTNLLSPLLVVACVPLYLFLLRPFVDRCVPGMLKRMGFGMFAVVLSIMCTFSMDTAAHLETAAKNNNNTMACIFRTLTYLSQNSLLLIVQLSLAPLSHMLMYVAVFEFICSQSPHSMKGFLIGLLYAVKGLYQVLATLLALPFVWGGCVTYTYRIVLVIIVTGIYIYIIMSLHTAL